MAINESVYQSGDTIKLMCEIRDFDGTLIDPDLIKVITYDYRYTKLNEVIMGPANKSSIGSYFMYFTTSVNPGGDKIIYEWYCEKAGKPSLKRCSFRTVFI